MTQNGCRSLGRCCLLMGPGRSSDEVEVWLAGPAPAPDAGPAEDSRRCVPRIHACCGPRIHVAAGREFTPLRDR